MTAPSDAHFKRQYQSYLEHLRLKVLQPKTIDVSVQSRPLLPQPGQI